MNKEREKEKDDPVSLFFFNQKTTNWLIETKKKRMSSSSSLLPRLIAITSEGAQRAAVEPTFRSLATTTNICNNKQLFSSVHFGSTIEEFKDIKTNSKDNDQNQPLVVVMGAPTSPKVLQYLMTDAIDDDKNEMESSTSSKSRPLTFRSNRVKLVHSLWTGLDGFDIPRLRTLLLPTNVPLSNARGVYSHMLAEHVLLSILYFTRQVPLLQQNKQKKIWDRFSSPTASGMTLLVAGFGEIGQVCAQRAIGGLNMKVVGVRSARSGGNNDINNINNNNTAPSSTTCPETGAKIVFGNDEMDVHLPNADVVLAVLPNTPATENTFDESRFAKFKKGFIFINIGRGKTVNDAALLGALNSNHLRGAAIDVFDPEPLPQESPLWSVDDSKMLLTPHNADVSHMMFQDAAAFFATEVAQRLICEGKLPEYLVDLEKGY